MKVRQINPINFIETEPEHFAEMSWPLVSQLGLDLLLGIATGGYETVLLLVTIHFTAVVIGWWCYNASLDDSLTISSEGPRESDLKKAA
jgi:hypothetical protein